MSLSPTEGSFFLALQDAAGRSYVSPLWNSLVLVVSGCHWLFADIYIHELVCMLDVGLLIFLFGFETVSNVEKITTTEHVCDFLIILSCITVRIDPHGSFVCPRRLCFWG